MTVTEAEIQAFGEFAREQAAQGGTNLSMSELAARWQDVAPMTYGLKINRNR